VSAYPKSQRIAYVDRLRGLAVLGMFFVHSGYAWLRPEDRDGAAYGEAVSQISGMVAPVFMFLVGLSMAITAARRRDDRASLGSGAALRGLQILGVGYGLGMTYLVLDGFPSEWTRMLKVDILQCIGVSMIALAPFVRPGRRLNWPALAVFFVLLLGAQVTWRLPLGEWMPDALAGYLTREVPGSRFPLFPYGAWVALGLFTGPLWMEASKSADRERRFWLAVIAAVLACSVLWLVGAWAHEATGLDRIGIGGVAPVTTVHFFLFKISVLFLLFGGARLTAAALERVPIAPLVLLGRTSLFGYCVHLIAVYHVIGPFWQDRLEPWEHIAGAAALTAVMFPLCWLWQRLQPARWL
jgi:uncharacterized membrane protein